MTNIRGPTKKKLKVNITQPLNHPIIFASFRKVKYNDDTPLFNFFMGILVLSWIQTSNLNSQIKPLNVCEMFINAIQIISSRTNHRTFFNDIEIIQNLILKKICSTNLEVCAGLSAHKI